LPTSGTLSKFLNPADSRLRLLQLGVVLLAGLLVHLAFVGDPGNRDDLAVFFRWLSVALAVPQAQFYVQSHINYPPGAMVIFESVAHLLRWFVHGQPSEGEMRIAIKLPNVIMDIVGGAVAYDIVRRYAAHSAALAAAAFLALNPAAIYDSAFWGQLDAFPAVLALIAVWLLLFANPAPAWVALVFAGLVKPPVFVILPFFLLYPFATSVAGERRKRLIFTLAGIVVAFAMTEALAIAFFPHANIVATTKALLGQMRYAGSARFPYTSLNAFNLWALFGDFFTSDRASFSFVPFRYWGYAIFIAIALPVYRRYALRGDAIALIEGSMLVLLAFFLFLTQIHERYLYYALTFMAPLVFMRRYAYAAALFTLTFLLNLEYGFTFMYLDDSSVAVLNKNEFAPWLVHLCALANLGVFFWLFYRYVAPTQEKENRISEQAMEKIVG
jgi:dolichyl-phosphate-mannose-protein mannosyltransferase